MWHCSFKWDLFIAVQLNMIRKCSLSCYRGLLQLQPGLLMVQSQNRSLCHGKTSQTSLTIAEIMEKLKDLSASTLKNCTESTKAMFHLMSTYSMTLYSNVKVFFLVFITHLSRLRKTIIDILCCLTPCLMWLRDSGTIQMFVKHTLVF